MKCQVTMFLGQVVSMIFSVVFPSFIKHGFLHLAGMFENFCIDWLSRDPGFGVPPPPFHHSNLLSCRISSIRDSFPTLEGAAHLDHTITLADWCIHSD